MSGHQRTHSGSCQAEERTGKAETGRNEQIGPNSESRFMGYVSEKVLSFWKCPTSFRKHERAWGQKSKHFLSLLYCNIDGSGTLDHRIGRNFFFPTWEMPGTVFSNDGFDGWFNPMNLSYLVEPSSGNFKDLQGGSLTSQGWRVNFRLLCMCGWQCNSKSKFN